MVKHFSRFRQVLCGLILLTVLVGCDSRGRKVDIASVEDTTFITPEAFIVLPLSAGHQVKLYDHWYDIYSDSGQIEEYLSRQATRFRSMYQEYGVPLSRRPLGKNLVLVMPTKIFIEPETGAKMGSVSRLTRLCREHGFYNVTVRRAGDQHAS